MDGARRFGLWAPLCAVLLTLAMALAGCGGGQSSGTAGTGGAAAGGAMAGGGY